jgi:rubrerythrin
MTTTAEALIDKLDAVPFVEFCSCGRPRSEHTYWVDRVYDYNGYSCPGTVGGDYRYDAILTTAKHREARAQQLADALRAAHEGNGVMAGGGFWWKCRWCGHWNWGYGAMSEKCGKCGDES